MATANNNSDRLLNFTLLVGDRVYLALFCGMYTQKPGRLLLLLVIIYLKLNRVYEVGIRRRHDFEVEINTSLYYSTIYESSRSANRTSHGIQDSSVLRRRLKRIVPVHALKEEICNTVPISNGSSTTESVLSEPGSAPRIGVGIAVSEDLRPGRLLEDMSIFRYC